MKIIARGICSKHGNEIAWELDIDGTLTLSGSGEMEDYEWAYCVPWFSYKYMITRIIINEGITSIGDRAFGGCTGLIFVTISDSVSRIGDYAFYYCTGLTSMTIPNSVTSIGGYAFYGCSGLTFISMPSSLSYVGEWPFFGCVKLHSKISKLGRYFKIFSKDMICRDFKYEEGKEYSTTKAILCYCGFHYCTSILALFNYYYGKENEDVVIHEVFPSGQIAASTFATFKQCCTNIKIGKQVSFTDINKIINNVLTE